VATEAARAVVEDGYDVPNLHLDSSEVCRRRCEAQLLHAPKMSWRDSSSCMAQLRTD
jgi:hypothetical protein